MKRLIILATVMMMLTVANAQKQGSSPRSKQTSYKFKFEYAVEMESGDETDCNVLVELIDRPGEKPRLYMVNNANGEVQDEQLKTNVIFNVQDGNVLLTNIDGEEMYFFTEVSSGVSDPSLCFLVMDCEDGKLGKAMFGLTNETGTPNDEQCRLAFKALLKTAQANAFNNFTVDTIK